MSDLRPGYKRTEIGVIPEDWEVQPANSICDLVVDCKNRTPPVVEAGEYAVVRTPNVRAGQFVREDLVFTDEASFREWTRRAVPRHGDVLITREAPLGEVCLAPRDLQICLGQRMMLYRPAEAKLDARFLVYACLSAGVHELLMSKVGGSTVGHARVDDIRALTLPVPPLNEQQAIAEALGDADALIATLEALVAKKRDLKQGAMQELLTGQRRLAGFQGEWVSKPIGSIFDFGRTIPLSRAQLSDDGSVKYVHYGDIHTSLHTHLDFETTTTPGVGKALCGAATPLRVGDWVFADASEDYDGVAKAVEITNLLADKDAVAGLHTMLLRERAPTFAPGFKGYLSYAPSFRAQVVRVATGMKVFGISKTQMKEVELYFPPIRDEQRAIAAVLSDMDAEIAALEEKLAKARAVKQGMMQVLLTGEVRLV
jgi:type I restriction enzyme, S subunit